VTQDSPVSLAFFVPMGLIFQEDAESRAHCLKPNAESLKPVFRIQPEQPL